MIDILLDENNNFILTQGNDMQTCTEKTLLENRIRQALRTIRQEWFLDTGHGLPWNNWIYDDVYEDDMRTEIISLMPDTTEIIKVDSIEFIKNDREMNINIKIETIYGISEVSI